MKKLTVIFILLAGIVIGAGGFWLIVRNSSLLHEYLLERPAGNQPQTQIEDFVQAILKDDDDTATALWEVAQSASGKLVERREQVVDELIETIGEPEYLVLNIEWWSTCCEPSVTCDSREAGGARNRVQFMDRDNKPVSYIFDVFTRQQSYWGVAEGYQPREWVIRDVYPFGEEPLFWRQVYEPEIKYIGDE